MTKTLEQFEQEVAEKRERLLKNLELVKVLPTNGKTVTWIGEGGFEKDGNTRKPDKEHTIAITPWIVHSPFRGHEHIAFQVPDNEYRYSKHRAEFARLYLQAVLDACEPYMIPTKAIRGTYASLVAGNWDYKANRDYKDAQELTQGLYELEVSQGKGYLCLKLDFYIHIPECGTVQVSIDLNEFPAWKLAARSRCDNLGIPTSWSFPTVADVGAVHLFKRSNADRNEHGVPSGYTMEWLYGTRKEMLAAIGIKD